MSVVDSGRRIARDLIQPVRKIVRQFQDVLVRGFDQAHIPVVVYQMGKVGSLSLRDSLNEHGVWPVSHVHRVNPEHIKKSQEAHVRRGQEPPVHQHSKGLNTYHKIVKPGCTAKFISLIREPVSRNISAFFFNYVTEKNSWDNLSVQQILDSFLSEYPHEVPLVWFDREPKATLEIDVYSEPFPHDRGYTELRNGPFELLVLRTELPDHHKSAAAEQFLGVSGFEIQRRNTGKSKEYADLYDQFKQEVSLPDSYLDRMLQSRYAQHFCSAEEIERAYARWS